MWFFIIIFTSAQCVCGGGELSVLWTIWTKRPLNENIGQSTYRQVFAKWEETRELAQIPHMAKCVKRSTDSNLNSALNQGPCSCDEPNFIKCIWLKKIKNRTWFKGPNNALTKSSCDFQGHCTNRDGQKQHPVHNKSHSSAFHRGNADSERRVRCNSISKKSCELLPAFTFKCTFQRKFTVAPKQFQENVTARCNNVYSSLESPFWMKVSVQCVHNQLWSACNVRYNPTDITWKHSLYLWPALLPPKLHQMIYCVC